MIKSAITVSLVEEARGGPFVFWNGLADAYSQAAQLGFDAIEIFAPGPDAVSITEVQELSAKHGLAVAAVGTGAGMVKHGLSLTDPDTTRRAQAREFVKQMIEFGGKLNAPAIIGSMQGRWGGDMSREQTLGILGEALGELSNVSKQFGVPLIYEPLNRYETNLITTIGDGVAYLKSLGEDGKNVKLLADLFHMNIEEDNLAAALLSGAGFIGHVHFVDSNRKAAGMGHMDYAPIAAALIESEFAGYASAEAFPLPDSLATATATIESFNKHFRS